MTYKIKLSYVKEQITKSLISLMKEETFEDITIKQIVETAGVGRASFYRNYKNKEDVIKQYMSVLIQEWGKEFEETKTQNLIESLMNHYYSEREFYKLLYKCGLSYYLLDTIKEACNINESKDNAHVYALSWFAGGLFCFIDEWIGRGMQETPEEMINLVQICEKSKSN